jgi:hypothetical protein
MIHGAREVERIMVSERQLISNRQNGKKGGPKTAAGKAVVRFNAVKHGLLSQHVVLPGEDEDAFEELRVSLMEAMKPQGLPENIQFDIILSTYWRLVRVVTFETCYMQARLGQVRTPTNLTLQLDQRMG